MKRFIAGTIHFVFKVLGGYFLYHIGSNVFPEAPEYARIIGLLVYLALLDLVWIEVKVDEINDKLDQLIKEKPAEKV